jgi:hypothetical protein
MNEGPFGNLDKVVSHLVEHGLGVTWVNGEILRPQDFYGYLVATKSGAVSEPMYYIDSNGEPEKRLRIVFLGGATWSLPLAKRDGARRP